MKFCAQCELKAKEALKKFKKDGLPTNAAKILCDGCLQEFFKLQRKGDLGIIKQIMETDNGKNERG